MKTLFSTLIALGLLAGVANAADLTSMPINDVVEYCGYVYRGH